VLSGRDLCDGLIVSNSLVKVLAPELCFKFYHTLYTKYE
jgi:hypothetical protein